MKNKGDLTRVERFEIKILLDKGYTIRLIAKSMNRGKSTISYEIKHNSVRGIYDPKKAHNKARLRKRMRRLQYSKIEYYPKLKRFIIEKLKIHWNPDEIAGYLKLHRKEYDWYVSKTAIYDWLRTSRGEKYCKCLYSKRKTIKKRKKNKTKRTMIPNKTSIHKRPKEIDRIKTYGHWESDSIVSKRNTKGGIKTATERKSKLLLAKKVSSMRPKEHSRILKEMTSVYIVKSFTYDNGIENKDYESLNIPSYFADPYSSWQRGINENSNKMLRRYFPKKTNFNLVSQKEIDYAVKLINEKPRKCLGYRSAYEVALENGIIKKIESSIINSESVLIQG